MVTISCLFLILIWKEERNRYLSESYPIYTLKHFYSNSPNQEVISVNIMEQTACLDFPFPNEIIEIVVSYLSPEELLSLAAITTERLKKCFSVLFATNHVVNTDLCWCYILSYLKFISSTNIYESFNFLFQNFQIYYAICQIKEIWRKSNKYLRTSNKKTSVKKKLETN